MKKLLAIALTLVLAWSASATLAEFSVRGYDPKEGYQYIALGEFPQKLSEAATPILWRVLSVEDGQALLLSEYVLFNNRIHPDDKEYIALNAEFNQTEMFSLLNGPFESDPLPIEEREALKEKNRLGRIHIATICFKDQAFSEAEQKMLLRDEALGTVFLLSADDLKNSAYGFASSRQRQAYGTEYAAANGLFVYQNGTSPYWTRSQSLSYDYATRCTKVDGALGYIRCVVMNEGCRPAIRLSLEGLEPTGGSGTMDDPFTFAR